jgi:hypothetical protein
MDRSKFPARFLMRAGVMALTMGLVCIAYQSQEDFIPCWDYARGYELFYQLVSAFKAGPESGLHWLNLSVNKAEYNALFALPFLGPGLHYDIDRKVLILLTTLFYGFFYMAAHGHLVKTLDGRASLDQVGYAPLLGGLLTPALFFNTLHGYETIAALPFFTLGLSFYLMSAYGQGRDRRRMFDFFFAGLLVMSAFIVRRPFAYMASSFYAGAVIFFVGELVLGKVQLRSGEARLRAGGLALTLTASVLMLALVCPGRVTAIMSTPYGALYKAYETSHRSILMQFAAACGYVLLASSLVGYVLFIAFRRASIGGRMAGFLLLAFVAGLVQWVYVVGYGLHDDKTTLFVPYLGAGVSMLLVCLGGGKIRKALSFAVVLVLAVNVAVSLGAFGYLNGGMLPAMSFAKPNAPMRRGDMPQLRELVGKLRELTLKPDGQSGRIFLIASSDYLNSDLLQQAEYAFFGRKEARLSVFSDGFVDGKSDLPVALLTADWVVTVLPPLTHINPKGQQSLVFALKEMEEGRPVLKDFEPVGTPVELRPRPKKILTVRIFKRVRPFNLAEGLDLVGRAGRSIEVQPVFPSPWASQSPSGFSAIRRMVPGESYGLTFRPDAGCGRVSAYLLRKLDGGHELSGTLGYPHDAAGGVRLRFLLLDYGLCRKGVEKQVAGYEYDVRAGDAAPFAMKGFHGDVLLKVEAEGLPSPSGKGSPAAAVVDLTVKRNN